MMKLDNKNRDTLNQINFILENMLALVYQIRINEIS